MIYTLFLQYFHLMGLETYIMHHYLTITNIIIIVVVIIGCRNFKGEENLQMYVILCLRFKNYILPSNIFLACIYFKPSKDQFFLFLTFFCRHVRLSGYYVCKTIEHKTNHLNCSIMSNRGVILNHFKQMIVFRFVGM